MSEILEQLILGNAGTSEKVTKHMAALNLSQSSLQLVDIPKRCKQKKEMKFELVFEHCIKTYKMIIIAVYKRNEDLSDEDKELFANNVNNPDEAKIREE